MTETTARARRSSGARSVTPYFSPLSANLIRSPLARRSGAFATSVAALVASDLVAVTLAILICASVSRNPHPLAQLPGVLGIALAWVGMRYSAGLYPGFGISPPEALRLGALTTLLAGVAHSAALISFRIAADSRAVSIGTWFLLLPLSVVFRGVVKAILVRYRLFGRPVVVLGAGQTGSFTITELLRDSGLGLVPVAAFDDDPVKHGSTLHGVPILGGIEAALTWEAPYEVEHAVVAMSGVGNRRLIQMSEQISRRYGNVSLVADTLGLGNLWITPQSFGRCLTLRVSSPRFSNRHLAVKRVCDLLIAIPAFIIALPIIVVSAIIVAILDGGSPFYFQNREGIHGERIKVWKIRTMVHDAEARLEALLASDESAREEWQRSMKLKRDPRIIPFIGAFLRRSSVDELPQLWSVLTGEMSHVGPRPLPDYHLAKFTPEFIALRRQVHPGISGYWQVTDRSDSNIEQHMASDRYYIENWSLWLDLWVLFRTVEAVLARRGAV
jgi:Undecaprenyl-phosphate galactose phosphotransferase WbaP